MQAGKVHSEMEVVVSGANTQTVIVDTADKWKLKHYLLTFPRAKIQLVVDYESFFIGLNDRSRFVDILRIKKNEKIFNIDGEIKYLNLTRCYYGEFQNQGFALI